MINIAIHGHFYQPPREDPWTGTVLHDPTAAPAHDWNERVCSECYLPNSCARILGMDGRIKTEINNYARLSFNFGPTLHRWIENHSPSLNKTLIESQSRAIAQAYNHIIMPLASEQDKLTQTVWGMEDFKYRFGRAPKGMWLPETAVDIPTLETLAARGVEFTILAPHQCRAVIIDSSPVLTSRGANLDVTRPYRCELPSGRSITIIFYHAGLAQGIAFGGLLNNGDLFKDAAVRAAAEGEDRILVTATDGESYGHHHKFGEMALARMFEQMELDERINLPSIERVPREASAHSKLPDRGKYLLVLRPRHRTLAQRLRLPYGRRSPAGTRNGADRCGRPSIISPPPSTSSSRKRYRPTAIPGSCATKQSNYTDADSHSARKRPPRAGWPLRPKGSAISRRRYPTGSQI